MYVDCTIRRRLEGGKGRVASGGTIVPAYRKPHRVTYTATAQMFPLGDRSAQYDWLDCVSAGVWLVFFTCREFWEGGKRVTLVE
jgi:hypothetical protein